MTMSTEIWKPIPGYNGDHEVSTHGRVKSWKRGNRRNHPGEEVNTIYQEALFGGCNNTEPIKGTVIQIEGPPVDGKMHSETEERLAMMHELGYTDVHPRMRKITFGKWEL